MIYNPKQNLHLLSYTTFLLREELSVKPRPPASPKEVSNCLLLEALKDSALMMC